MPEDLIRDAQMTMSLTDFGEWSFDEPLAVLLRAYEEEAELGAFGRLAVCWDMLRFLSNLLRLHDEEKRAPEILDEPIERPVFILAAAQRNDFPSQSTRRRSCEPGSASLANDLPVSCATRVGERY